MDKTLFIVRGAQVQSLVRELDATCSNEALVCCDQDPVQPDKLKTDLFFKHHFQWCNSQSFLPNKMSTTAFIIIVLEALHGAIRLEINKRYTTGKKVQWFSLTYYMAVKTKSENISTIKIISLSTSSLDISLRYRSESESHSVVSNSLRPHGLYSPWNSPNRNIGVGSYSLLQGIVPTQGLNPGLPHCRQILYQLSHKWSPTYKKTTVFLCTIKKWSENEMFKNAIYINMKKSNI